MLREIDAMNYHVSLHVIGQNVALPQLSEAVPSIRKTCSYGSASAGFRAVVDVDIRWVIDPPDQYQVVRNVDCRTHSSGREHDDG